MSTFTQGQVVRFTRGPLGCFVELTDSSFAEHTVAKGDEGVYNGRYEGTSGWHIVSVAHDGRTLYVPVHTSHIEAG